MDPANRSLDERAYVPCRHTDQVGRVRQSAQCERASIKGAQSGTQAEADCLLRSSLKSTSAAEPHHRAERAGNSCIGRLGTQSGDRCPAG
jgi:hypothetical protein